MAATVVTAPGPPADSVAVRKALRLGWAIAELRGRYLLGAEHVGLLAPGAKRRFHALPLAAERSEAEQKCETHVTLTGLAEDPDLGLGAANASPLTPADHGLSDGASVRDLLRALEYRMDHAQAPITADKSFDQFTEALWRWDSKIQDTFTLRPTIAAAYQLGRGLAETYWSLDPSPGGDADDGWRSWEFLLGSERREFLKRQLGRLDGYLDPLTPSAVSTSLYAWGAVAAREDWRKAQHARRDLYQQTLLWRDLLRGERRPEALISQRTRPWQVGVSWRIVRSLAPQLLLGVVSLLLLVGGVVALSKGKDTVLAPVITVLASVGLTGASALAKAKASAQSLLAQLRLSYHKDLVGQAAIIRPPNPSRRQRRREDATLKLGPAPEIAR
jgi:hypothetical protein